MRVHRLGQERRVTSVRLVAELEGGAASYETYIIEGVQRRKEVERQYVMFGSGEFATARSSGGVEMSVSNMRAFLDHSLASLRSGSAAAENGLNHKKRSIDGDSARSGKRTKTAAARVPDHQDESEDWLVSVLSMDEEASSSEESSEASGW